MLNILDKRRRDQIVEHLVQWDKTEHPSDVLHLNSEGNWVIDIAGVEYKVARHEVSTTDPNMKLITWKPSWHRDWELPKESVARFEERLGEVKTDSQETLEPSWWTWEEHEQWYVPPEPEPLASSAKVMSLDCLEPEVNSDYTISFLEQLRRQLMVEGELSKPSEKTIIAFLNRRIRQRIRFPTELVGEGRTLFLGREERTRALLVYAFGFAHRALCKCCGDSPGPFAKCVIFPGQFAGACANCVFKRQRKQCDYHDCSKCGSAQWLGVPLMIRRRHIADTAEACTTIANRRTV